MSEKTIELSTEFMVIIVIIVVGLLLIGVRVNYLVEEKRVIEMDNICENEYQRTYSHHDQYHFWCFNSSTNNSLGLVRVQWNDAWERPFEVPFINFSGNIT